MNPYDDYSRIEQLVDFSFRLFNCQEERDQERERRGRGILKTLKSNQMENETVKSSNIISSYNAACVLSKLQ